MALPPPSPTSTCVVTGASSGIGADIARSLARRGHGLTLVARRAEPLTKLADELTREHDVRAEKVTCDVTNPKARERLVKRVDDHGLTVDVVVNNAGFGSAGLFQQLDADDEVRMVRTNVEAVVALCGEYVPRMVTRGHGAILNVASVAGFQPLPRQATYGATKAFVLSFTEALHEDLHGTGVTATSLSPGPVPTGFQEVAKMESEMDRVPSFMVMSSEDTAEAGVKAMENGRRGVVPGTFNMLGAIGGQHVPRSVFLPLARRLYPAGK